METELSRPISDEEDNMQLFDDDNDNEEPGNPMDEAVEVPVPDEDGTLPKTIKPKRVIKNPQPKLDAVRLMGPRGVGILQSTFKDVKFRGKGYEKEDLRLLMKNLEHWAHRLFPKFTFDDSLKQIEKLGSKKNVQNMVKRIRLDMFQSDELNENSENNETSNNDNVPEVDVFDQLLSTGPFAEHSSTTVPNQTENTSLTFASSQPSTPVSLTEEQRERIAMKRLEALERRRKRLQEQETEKEISMLERTQNSITFPIDDATANLANKDSPSEDREVTVEDVTTNLATKETSSKDKEDEMEDVTTNFASKESPSEDRDVTVEDVTTNLATKETSSKDKEDEMEDVTTNFASKESSSENKDDKVEDVTTNSASKESSSEDAEDKMEDVTTNLASKESSSEDKMEDSTMNLASKESSSNDKEDNMEDSTMNLASKESSKENKMEDISVENSIENSHLKDQNEMVSLKSTPNDDDDGFPESKRRKIDEESNDVEIVAEDDLLSLIN